MTNFLDRRLPLSPQERAVLKEFVRRNSGGAVPAYPEWFRETLPNGWSVPDHVRRINEHLEAVERGEIDRLAIHMPPRHGKSETVTVRFPLRWIERKPSDNVLVCGYNERFARKFSRRIRNMAKAKGLVAGDKSASDEWGTNSGGLVMARGVQNPPTGTGFNLIVIDDPVKRREEAESETYREKVWDWYTDDLYNRLEPSGKLVLVMTLWHEDDLGARAVASEPERWTVLKLPAISEAGQALWPERYTVEDLERIRGVMSQNEGERSFEALYQQNPRPREGSLFKIGWFGTYRGIPPLKWVATFWDTALKAKEENDETACVTVGAGEDGYAYILRAASGRWETPAVGKFLVEQAKWLKDLYGDVYIGDYVEDKVSGTTLMQFLRTTNPEVPVIPIVVEGDKVARANGVTPMCEAGRVLLPDLSIYPEARAWSQKLTDNLLAFPLGKHDDLTDVFVYGLKRFMGTLKVRTKRQKRKGGYV
jgi:predicted phage terminase large subunit-like protein